uniref:site-specific DNA-methyltransferase (cytosine-N(4)-specific) n=1 Tax=Candidatus Kentrum sp. DK TaxID=2126562 RepID=A0A450TJU2_9GAMM|nr:MAG: hypothetical protein BECKDK2373C_GA0170839_11694 [Candidatus Kentron sp. DK]
MIHIHPFPARMSPDVALEGLESLPSDSVVLDPMSGSGMVLGTAAKLGLTSIGYDLDPLAHMISRTNGTYVNDRKVQDACDDLLSRCHSFCSSSVFLPWIDDNNETQRYIDFWFAPKQQAQLRVLSHFLVADPFISDRKVVDILKVAVSRLIVTKEPKASLARDTAHSRPHRTITENNFDIYKALPGSLKHVLSALQADRIKTDVKIHRGDARKMEHIHDCSVDCIVTSPPYLNAIDYMRGHRLSLVWFGFSVPVLREIRARSVGAEIAENCQIDKEFGDFLSALHPCVDDTKRRVLRRYCHDLCKLTDEAFRVLRPGRKATYVIGNSTIKGQKIRNSDFLISAAKRSGFGVCEQTVRDIPENRRYMPLLNSGKSDLAKRMRTEHVLVFKKIAPQIREKPLRRPWKSPAM